MLSFELPYDLPTLSRHGRKICYNPSSTINVNEQEIHYFSTIQENEGRCLKVVVNPLKYLMSQDEYDSEMKDFMKIL